jgi:hypothetical protein
MDSEQLISLTCLNVRLMIITGGLWIVGRFCPGNISPVNARDHQFIIGSSQFGRDSMF